MTHGILATSMTRRHVVRSSFGAAALTLLPARALFAQAAQGSGSFASLGYPELKITVTDTGFEGVPASTTAGRYLLTATNKMTQKIENAGSVAFVSGTPVGMSAADLAQFLASLFAPAGTPNAGDQAGGGELTMPLVVYQWHFAGGVYPTQGETAQAVIDLMPGDYVVWGDDPTAPQKPATVNVTGAFPQRVQDPPADITATLIDFAIQVEGSLTAGKHLLKVLHQGAQPHFLDLAKGPATMTKEQVEATLAGEMSGTPAAGGVSENDLQSVFYSPTQSIGTVTYQHVELTAGTFLAECFFPTAGTGVPHAMNGMVDVFKVTG